MGNIDYDVDPVLLAEFLDESLDMLSDVDRLFVQLEASPHDMTIVESIFRPVHSIKGNSAFFGCVHVKALAHEMETLLDLVRKDALRVTQPLIDVLLKGVDRLRQILERVREREPEIQDEKDFADFVESVKGASAGQEADIADSLGKALNKLAALREQCTVEAPGLLEPLEALEKDLKALIPVEEMPESAPSGAAVDASSPIGMIQDILAEPIQDQLPDDLGAEVLKALRELEKQANDDPTKAAVADALDSYETCMATVGFDSLLQELLLTKMDELSRRGVWLEPEGKPGPAEAAAAQEAPAVEPSPKAPSRGADEKAAEKAAIEAAKTMRVSEAHIDTFLAFVGELIVIGDMFGNLHKRISTEIGAGEIAAAFRGANESFMALSNDLQESIMSIRKVSVRALLQKVPRMVRDIAAKSAKEIAVELEGESVEVDKSLMDMLDAPLTHMVRNAADHGIQPPSEREAAGKPRQGVVRVAVSEGADTIVLSVKDDGAGLNLDAIRRKAESMGLVKPGQQLRQDDIVSLIFSSGVSTAKEVTDVSGRGVGMDVVKRMIEEAGGAITVSSAPGEGSEFRVQLPKTVTTQIIPGFLVEVNTQCYVLPMDRVHETTKVSKERITTVVGQGECVTLHGTILPVLELWSVLGLRKPQTQSNERVVVTVEAKKRQFAVVVDNVLGVRKVVLRQIDGLEERSPAIAGGALMGDGSVALVIDVEKLCERRRARLAQEST